MSTSFCRAWALPDPPEGIVTVLEIPVLLGELLGGGLPRTQKPLIQRLELLSTGELMGAVFTPFRLCHGFPSML